MIKKYLIAFLTLISFFWCCYADVIPEDSHYIDRCAKIENTSIDGYKPIQIIELHYWNEAYPIEEWKCLDRGIPFTDEQQEQLFALKWQPNYEAKKWELIRKWRAEAEANKLARLKAKLEAAGATVELK